MTQLPYRPAGGHPMRRFAIFTAVLFVVVVIGSQPWNGGRQKGSFCVCIPSRAGLILRSMTSMSAITKTQASSSRRLAVKVTASSPKIASQT